jgi:hypothetical protein
MYELAYAIGIRFEPSNHLRLENRLLASDTAKMECSFWNLCSKSNGNQKLGMIPVCLSLAPLDGIPEHPLLFTVPVTPCFV